MGEYDYRSKSTPYDRRDMQMQPYTGPPAKLYLETTKEESGPSSSGKIWGFSDPEFQRKKRVASYKVYGVERKVKGSFRKSSRWFKDKYAKVVYGWW